MGGSWSGKLGWGRQSELRVLPGPSRLGTQGWILSWGSARHKQCSGTLVWLLYCMSRSRVNETNTQRKSCTHGMPKAGRGLLSSAPSS